MAKPRGIADDILELRSQNLSYSQICEKLNCSKASVSYHLGKGQKAKCYARTQKSKDRHPYIRKIERFIYKLTNNNKKISNKVFNKQIYDKIMDFTKNSKKDSKLMTFNLQDIISKFGENPKCYLTGDPINIYEPSSYHFDHIIPRSKGGDNSLDNLGICTKQANICKSDLTPDELYKICEKIVKNRQERELNS